MNKLNTVSIGIPAYNESKNIRRLLRALSKQKQENFKIEKILIVSDGSSDNTLKEIRRVSNPHIKVLAKKNREGKTVALNYIFKHITSDYLVLMDADVLPSNNLFVKTIVDEFADNSTGLVCTKPIPVTEKTFFEKIINNSHKLKLIMNDSFLNSNQVYLANGRSLGLSKALYTKVVLPIGVIADDAYIFFSCLKLKLHVRYSKDSVVFYRSPGNLTDHIKQSVRFYNSQKQLVKFFNEHNVHSQYSIRTEQYVQTVLKGFIKDPISTISYIGILLYAKLLSYGEIKVSHLWSPSISSKNI